MCAYTARGSHLSRGTPSGKILARHVLHGLEMIVSQAMHTHAERRMRSAAAREADFDVHRAEVRSFGCGGHDHREYDYRG